MLSHNFLPLLATIAKGYCENRARSISENLPEAMFVFPDEPSLIERVTQLRAILISAKRAFLFVLVLWGKVAKYLDKCPEAKAHYEAS